MANIIIVDDSPSLRDMLTTTLLSSNYQVDDAADGPAALCKLKASQYDIIISDINMPEMNGIELVKAIRALKNYKYTPILLLTTEFSIEKKFEGRSAGATGWLEKPVDPTKLISTIERMLN
jgi:two-component system, chemotaxis family, chemotaxis protein CheY